MHIIVSTSKAKKVKVAEHKRGKPTGWNRSKLLKLVMPLLSGGNGEDLIDGLNNKDAEKVKKVMEDISASVVKEAIDNEKEAQKKVKDKE